MSFLLREKKKRSQMMRMKSRKKKLRKIFFKLISINL
jgi:hypothetical protein